MHARLKAIRLGEACLATQRIHARQSKQAMRAIKQLSNALRRAKRRKVGPSTCKVPWPDSVVSLPSRKGKRK